MQQFWSSILFQPMNGSVQIGMWNEPVPVLFVKQLIEKNRKKRIWESTNLNDENGSFIQLAFLDQAWRCYAFKCCSKYYILPPIFCFHFTYIFYHFSLFFPSRSLEQRKREKKKRGLEHAKLNRNGLLHGLVFWVLGRRCYVFQILFQNIAFRHFIGFISYLFFTIYLYFSSIRTMEILLSHTGLSNSPWFM